MKLQFNDDIFDEEKSIIILHAAATPDLRVDLILPRLRMMV